MSFSYPKDVCSNNRHSRRPSRVRPGHAASALVVTCVAGAVAHAQDRLPPGLVATFDVSQRLEYSDNPDFDVNGTSDFYGRTVLGFGLDSIRSIDRFELDLGTDIEEGRDDQSGVDLTNSFARVLYDRDTRNARFGLNARYRESDVNSNNFDEEFDQDGDVINQTEGTRTTFGFGIDAAVGREAPIGSSFSWDRNDISYSSDADPDLNDSQREQISGQIDFRIDPRITASLTAKYDETDFDGDGVDRKTTGFGSALNLEVTQVDTLNLFVSQDRIERSGDETGTDEGLSGGIGWLRARPNGTVGLDYSSDVASNVDGRRSSLSVSRTMDLPRGALSLTLGATGTDTVGRDPLVQADYRHALSSSVLTFGLSQTVNTDDDNNEEINTRLRASYDQEINSLSSFGVSLSFFDRNELQDDPNDGQRLDISLTYRHDLTRDWGLVGGFTHRFSTEDAGEDRSSNTIFVGIERSFSWNP